MRGKDVGNPLLVRLKSGVVVLLRQAAIGRRMKNDEDKKVRDCVRPALAGLSRVINGLVMRSTR